MSIASALLCITFAFAQESLEQQTTKTIPEPPKKGSLFSDFENRLYVEVLT
jgi:hypothetical protein